MDESNAEKVIKAFGGVSKLSSHLRISRQLVNSWRKTGKVPAKYHGDLINLRTALNIDIDIKDICS